MTQKEEFNFEPKRILKHKDHVTINEGQKYDATVQHLKYDKEKDEFTELKKNEAAKKYGSKKLVRDLDFNNRDGLQVKDSGLGNTPKWFQQVLPTIQWSKYRTFLYEIDHLWLNMFFTRELYGEEREGREQILELTQNEEQGLTLNVLAELEYSSQYQNQDYNDEDINAVIKVEIVEEEKQVKGKGEGREYDVDVEYKQSFWKPENSNLASGLREIMTGIALKHDHTDEQLHLQISEVEDGYTAELLNKDFAVKFNKTGSLKSGVSPWVLEMLHWDGCPLNMETIKVTK